MVFKKKPQRNSDPKYCCFCLLKYFFVQDYDELEAEHLLSLKKPRKAPAKNKPFGMEKPKNYPATAGSDVEPDGRGN